MPGYDSLTYCSYPTLYITTDAYSDSLSVKTYYGNGQSSTSAVYNGTGHGFAYCYSQYSFPGNYTTKYVLVYGSLAVDSVVETHEYLYCSSTNIKCVNDSSGTGVYDSLHDHAINIPLKIEVTYNGAPVDTIIVTSGRYYEIRGSIGDVYSYKIINVPAGFAVTFPVGGVIYDTVKLSSASSKINYFGLECNGSTNFDLAVNAVKPITGVGDQSGDIYVSSNISCYAIDATVVLDFSPKYVAKLIAFDPTPTSVIGNVATWNLNGITSRSNAIDLHYQVVDSAGDVVAGDTVHRNIQITPITGDTDSANNTEVIIDSVKAGVDPNEMSVSPGGYIASGTQLQYTIGFKNTGNDTAYNISLYDTLSDYVDIKSLNLVMASAVMNIAVLTVGGKNIIRFDFPNINLLDSSYHGLCNGAVIFTINVKDNLPPGTTIFNHAGIFFDYNPVVMTDTVEDIIGFPASVTPVNKTSKVLVYPNPASDEVTIIADNTSYSTATFTNVLGQQLLTQSLTASQIKVNVSKLGPGMYYITLRGEGGVKVVKLEKM